MSAEFWITVILLAYSAALAFVAFWVGVDHGERARVDLRDAQHRHPSTPSNLRIVTSDENAS